MATMSRNGSSGGLTLKEVRASVVAGLRSRRPEVEESIFAHVLDGVPDPVGVGDAEYLAGLRATITAVVEYCLAGIDLGVERSVPVPSAAVTQAQHAVRLGVSLETVLCRYIVGYKLLVKLVTREAEDIYSEKGALADVLSLQASLLERLVSSITCVYLGEVECVAPPERRHAELVRRLLDGGIVDVPFPGYDFDAWHIGVIATGANAQRALQFLAADQGQRLFAVERDDGVVWAWLGGRRKLVVRKIECVLSSGGWPAEVSLAVGEPARGVDGWRQTHWQAQEALRVLREPQRLSFYAHVAIPALVLQNEEFGPRLVSGDIVAHPGCRRDDEQAGQLVRSSVRASTKDIRVVLGQFGGLVGRGLREVLQDDESLRLIGRDLDRAALECALAEQKPEIAILDEASVTDPSLMKLLAAQPEIGLVVLAHLPSRAYAARLLAAGATCLSKDASAADICATVHLAAEGHHMLTFAVDPQDRRGTRGETIRLTPRQAEVSQYMRLGMSYPTIAHTLGISVETVRTHAREVLSKLGVTHKSELVGLQAASAEPSSCSLISLPPRVSPQDPPDRE